MRKTLTLSALLVVLSLGIVWSATASAPVVPSGLSGLSGAEMRAKPTPTPTPTGPCSISCPDIPSISCSGTSSCTLHFDGRDGIFIITCDGHSQACI